MRIRKILIWFIFVIFAVKISTVSAFCEGVQFDNSQMVMGFVERMYTYILERNADSEGLMDWTGQLLFKLTDGAEVAEGFVMSEEFILKDVNDEEYVKKLYLTLFDRVPSTDEVNRWVFELENGASREEVLAGFINSVEFENLCKTYGIDPGHIYDTGKTSVYTSGNRIDSSSADREKISQYVERLYNKALGRDSESDGKEYWINQIVSGKEYDAATVAKIGFFESAEYKQKKKTNGEFITDAYHAFFGREPDDSGYKYWMMKLATGEYDRPGMIEVGFGRSEEFKNLLVSYGFRLINNESSQDIESFKPVPINELANYSSIRKKMTDAEFQEAYNIALEIVTPLANMSREKQLKELSKEMRKRFENGTYSMSEDHYNDPYGYFVLGTASCAGCTRATGLCLNILGIPYEHVNENQYTHQWCRVNVNGTYWICDAFGMYAGPEPGPYQHPNVIQ